MGTDLCEQKFKRQAWFGRATAFFVAENETGYVLSF